MTIHDCSPTVHPGAKRPTSSGSQCRQRILQAEHEYVLKGRSEGVDDGLTESNIAPPAADVAAGLMVEHLRLP
ncbi:hypothetical protein ACFWVT_35550 [Streptomyces cyaneofuscatus]|uniref:hypothetical protein n=1 Tax=Streptomyces cyaneofuscatus TaxID=66883 RepID=UPI00364A0E71